MVEAENEMMSVRRQCRLIALAKSSYYHRDMGFGSRDLEIMLAIDNIFIERLWWTLKQEEVYLKEYENVKDCKNGLREYFRFYNSQRPHQALDYRTPEAVYLGQLARSAS